MATATRKRPRATAVNQELVGQASAFLQELPEKQKEDLSLREAVKQMQDPLKAALAKGYSYEDLAKMLAGKGIKISALTLKNYIPSGKRQTAKTKAKRVKKSIGEADASVEPASEEAISPQESSETSTSETPSNEVTAEPTPAPTKARRGRAKSAETTKSAAAKTKADSETSTRQSRTRKSSTAKATSKSPSTRGRRKSEAAK